LANVLILAREEVVAALLGLMVELRGMQPEFLQEGESVAEAVDRVGHVPVLIDCDHPGCTEENISLIRESGGEPVVFSPFRMQTEVTRLAARYRTKSFTLPTDPDTFGRLLKS
jgi:tRNA pseudouridine-54 N-methylase